MTLNEYKAQIQDRINKLQGALLLAASSAHAAQAQRIFSEGENSEGGTIGAYNSTNGLYVEPKNAPRKFTPKGKTGKTKFTSGNKKGQAHATGYFPSYKDFREAQGRQTGTVDLRLSGRLQLDFTNSLQKSGDNYIVGAKEKENGDKINGAIHKYGNVFKLSQVEHDIFKKSLAEERRRYNV